MSHLSSQVLALNPLDGAQEPPLRRIGSSRQGRALFAYSCGSGPRGISLIAGCHADEPVGPLMLRYLVAFLETLPVDHPLKRDYFWAIVMHANPDGAEINRPWYDGVEDLYDPATYLKYVVREKPGDDIEFGFPRGVDDLQARPENRAIQNWWASLKRPFHLHMSLHGMGKAAGPWYLIDRAWIDRSLNLQKQCAALTAEMGYDLHDDKSRQGQKGFNRIAQGFCTRPDSVAMAKHFNDLDEPEMAAKFRPSSMEAIRAISAVCDVDTLTLVSEMPLFITNAEKRLPTPMPIVDQMRLQLGFLEAGMQTITKER